MVSVTLSFMGGARILWSLLSFLTGRKFAHAIHQAASTFNCWTTLPILTKFCCARHEARAASNSNMADTQTTAVWATVHQQITRCCLQTWNISIAGSVPNRKTGPRRVLGFHAHLAPCVCRCRLDEKPNTVTVGLPPRSSGRCRPCAVSFCLGRALCLLPSAHSW